MSKVGTWVWSVVALLLCGAVVEEGMRYVYRTASSSSNLCTMTYMGPEYVPIEVPDLPAPYQLYAYHDRAVPAPLQRGAVVPVLFVPGHGGAYEQARSLGHVALDQAAARRWLRRVAVYTLDFGGAPVALRGRSLAAQVRAARAALAHIRRAHAGAAPVLVGHSMGGCVAALAALGGGSESGAPPVAGVVGLSSPFVAPPFTHDGDLDRFYAALHAALAAPRGVPVISLIGGQRDALVPAHLCDVGNSGLDHGFGSSSNNSNRGYRLTVHTASIPGVLLSTDHQCIVWCREVVDALADVVQALGSGSVPRVHTRLVNTLPNMFIDQIIPYSVPVIPQEKEQQEQQKEQQEEETLINPEDIPAMVTKYNGTVVLDLEALRAQGRDHVLLRARVEGLEATWHAVPHVLLCDSRGPQARCTNATAAWTRAPTRAAGRYRAPGTHVLWLSAPALRPHRLLRLRVRGSGDVVRVHALAPPHTVPLPAPSNLLTGLLKPMRVVAPSSGRALHLAAPLWRHDRPLVLRVAPGSGPHVLLAVHTPRSMARHVPEITFVGSFGGDGKTDSKSTSSVTLAATFDPQALDVFVVPTGEGRAAAHLPLEVTLQLDVPALLGGLFRANSFAALAAGAALLVLAHTGALLAQRSLLPALALQLPAVTVAVATYTLLVPRSALSPEQGLFFCAAGFFAAAAYLVVARILFVPFRVSVALFRCFRSKKGEKSNNSDGEKEGEKEEKEENKDKDQRSNKSPTWLFILAPAVVSILLATVWPFYVLVVAVVVLLARAAVTQDRTQRTRLLGAVAAAVPATAFAMTALLDSDSPVLRPAAELGTLVLHGSEPAALVAAIHAVVGTRRPLSRAPRLVRSSLIIFGALATAIIGAAHTHLAPAVALVTLLLV